MLSILEQLPRTSAYAQALATDEKLADQLVQLPEGGNTGRPTWTRAHRDYSPEVEMLTAVYDRLGELIAVSAAARGARGKPPAPGPRPVHAVDRVRRVLSQDRHNNLVSRVVQKKPAE